MTNRREPVFLLTVKIPASLVSLPLVNKSFTLLDSSLNQLELSMKRIILLLGILFLSATVDANTDEFDAKQFALHYYKAWTATQAPKATKADIEIYLKVLTDDVGHQHLPYDPDATRSDKGKLNMREGMLYYLNAHAEYRAELKNVVIGFNVVVIEYGSYAKGKHPQTGEWIEHTYNTVEVLELENGKVAVIRKYSE